MPQVIYLPKPINPLTDQLPQFLQQLVLLKMGHKMDMEKAQTTAKLAAAQKTSETQEKAENKGFRPGPWDTSQPGVATIGGTPYKAPAPPQQGYVFNPTKGDFGEYEDQRAKTFDEAYLRQNPNATPGQMAQYKKSTYKDVEATNLNKLISERDALPNGHPNRKIYDQAISKQVSSKGMVIESDGKGGFTIRTNAEQGGPSNLTKPNQTRVQEDLINNNESLVRLSSIMRSFKPEFQEIPKRMGIGWDQLKSKMGVNINDADKKQLEEFSNYRTNAIDNLNKEIRAQTGATMNKEEAKRITEVFPNAGTGIFDGDDPITTQSKIKNIYKKLVMTNARYSYYLKSGVDAATLKTLINSGDVMSLDEMETTINKRGKELENKIKAANPGIDNKSMVLQVKAALSREFGVE